MTDVKLRPHYTLDEMISAVTTDAITDVPPVDRFSGRMRARVLLLADWRYRCAVTDRAGNRAVAYVTPTGAQKAAPASAASFDTAARAGLLAALDAGKLRDDRERRSGRVVVRRTTRRGTG